MFNTRGLVSLLVACSALFLTLFRADLQISSTKLIDFEMSIYYPVVAFLAGENPYDSDTYLSIYPLNMMLPLFLPSTLLLHFPFGILPVELSSAVYFLSTLALTFALGWVSLVLTKQKTKISDVLLIGGLILLTRAGRWNVVLGQLALQFVFASYAALHFAKRSPVVSGVALSISVIKPTFGIPIALLMLFQGYVRPVLYGAIVATVTNVPLLILLAYRAGGIDSFLSSIVNNHNFFQNSVYNNPALSITRIDVVAFISRFMQAPVGLIAEVTIFVVILCIAGWALRRRVHPEDERNCALGVGVVCLATLLCVYHQTYDLLLLTLPFVGLVRRRFPEAFYSSYRYPLSIVLLTILALNYGASSSIIRFVPQGSGLWLFFVSINSAALLTLFCLWILPLKKPYPQNAQLGKKSISTRFEDSLSKATCIVGLLTWCRPVRY